MSVNLSIPAPLQVTVENAGEAQVYPATGIFLIMPHQWPGAVKAEVDCFAGGRWLWVIRYRRLLWGVVAGSGHWELERGYRLTSMTEAEYMARTRYASLALALEVWGDGAQALRQLAQWQGFLDRTELR